MNANSRLRFPPGKQKEFVSIATARCGNGDVLARFIGVSSRTIRDWRREKFLMSYEAAYKIVIATTHRNRL